MKQKHFNQMRRRLGDRQTSKNNGKTFDNLYAKWLYGIFLNIFLKY